jgi:flagellar hook-length control protein FliK
MDAPSAALPLPLTAPATGLAGRSRSADQNDPGAEDGFADLVSEIGTTPGDQVGPAGSGVQRETGLRSDAGAVAADTVVIGATGLMEKAPAPIPAVEAGLETRFWPQGLASQPQTAVGKAGPVLAQPDVPGGPGMVGIPLAKAGQNTEIGIPAAAVPSAPIAGPPDRAGPAKALGPWLTFGPTEPSAPEVGPREALPDLRGLGRKAVFASEASQAGQKMQRAPLPQEDRAELAPPIPTATAPGSAETEVSTRRADAAMTIQTTVPATLTKITLPPATALQAAGPPPPNAPASSTVQSAGTEAVLPRPAKGASFTAQGVAPSAGLMSLAGHPTTSSATAAAIRTATAPLVQGFQGDVTSSPAVANPMASDAPETASKREGPAMPAGGDVRAPTPIVPILQASGHASLQAAPPATDAITQLAYQDGATDPRPQRPGLVLPVVAQAGELPAPTPFAIAITASDGAPRRVDEGDNPSPRAGLDTSARLGPLSAAPATRITPVGVTAPMARAEPPTANFQTGELGVKAGLEQPLPGGAPPTPSAAALSGPPGTMAGQGASIPHHIAQHIAANLPKPVSDLGTGTLELALDPPELGRVRMSLVEIAGTLTLSITAERPETAELMRRHMDILNQEFSRSGLDAPDVHVGTGADGNGRAQDRDGGSGAGPSSATPEGGRQGDLGPQDTHHAASIDPSRALDLRL